MRYDAEKAAIVMSVGELCERANLPIHLDTRPGGAKRSAERAAIGREAHKRIQKNTDKGDTMDPDLTVYESYRVVTSDDDQPYVAE